MSFVLDVAADLYGHKENLEVSFAECPKLGELHARIEQLFQVEATVQRPPGAAVQHVRVSRCQIYDDLMQCWVDLVSSGQLRPYAQVYAFQKGGIDSQGEIPPSSPPRTRCVVPSASPMRARSLSPGYSAGSPRAFGGMLAQERREILEQREPTRGASDGPSLLQQERENENYKADLSLDEHRERTRSELREYYVSGHSPARLRTQA